MLSSLTLEALVILYPKHRAVCTKPFLFPLWCLTRKEPLWVSDDNIGSSEPYHISTLCDEETLSFRRSGLHALVLTKLHFRITSYRIREVGCLYFSPMCVCLSTALWLLENNDGATSVVSIMQDNYDTQQQIFVATPMPNKCCV